MRESLAEIVKCAEQITRRAQDIDKGEGEDDPLHVEQLRADVRYWERRFEELVEKVEDFERGMVTRPELVKFVREEQI